MRHQRPLARGADREQDHIDQANSTQRRAKNPSAEIARQFALMCERTALRSGPVTTSEIELLATQLVPEALERIGA